MPPVNVAAPSRPTVLTRRADFLAANSGLRNARPGFVLLVRPNNGQGMRYGITVTKKIGNAVVRNRMKRRFRELLRAALPQDGLPDHDHVLIGREGGVGRDFARLGLELHHALKDAATGKSDKSRGRRPVRPAKARAAS
jgi:ribonuclease P protein component